MKIITGEKIQQLADFFIGEPDDFCFNPEIRVQSEKHISIFSPSFPNVAKPIVVFCYTHLMEKHLSKLHDLLSTIASEFILLFHNSDHAFKEEHFHLLTIPKLKKIYTQNIMIPPSDLVIPIPIGIANTMWKHGNLQIWENILETADSSLKPNHIYFHFNIQTNIHLRSDCYQEMMKRKIPHQQPVEYKEYLSNLQTFQYGICPEGNGLDTHRFWECLYLKTIPICTRNYVTVYYSQFYPVVLVDSWQTLDIGDLQTSVKDWSNYNMLDFSYISSAVKNGNRSICNEL